MKKIFISLFLMLISCTLFAQSDTKSQEILKGVSTKYKSLKSCSAKFTVKVKDAKNNTTENQSGTILIKGPKYKLLIGDQEIYCDGKSVWTFLKEANEVQLNNYNADGQSITPTTIFTIYEKGFKTRFMQENVVNGKTIQVVELVPENTKKNYFKIQLSINKSDKQITQAKIFQRDGTTLFYFVDAFTANVAANDSDFVFEQKKYAGVELIDLR